MTDGERGRGSDGGDRQVNEETPTANIRSAGSSATVGPVEAPTTPPNISLFDRFIRVASAFSGIGSTISAAVALFSVWIVSHQFLFNQEVADRLWASQLLAVLYDSGRCEAKHCPPVANIRSREEALKAYIELQRRHRKSIGLREVDLSGMFLPNVDLSGISLVGANLRNINLTDGSLAGTDLTDAKLQGSRLENAHMERARLLYASMQGANLANAILIDASLYNAKLGICDEANRDLGTGEQDNDKSAILTGANLKGSTFGYAELCGVDIRRADLRNVDLRDTRGLLQEQLESSIGDAETTKPPWGLRTPNSWLHTARN